MTIFLFTIGASHYTINIDMETRVIKIDMDRSEQAKNDWIVAVLRNEGVVVYPTDTFYGLGASCFSQKAIKTIYKIKQREANKPISVVISGLEMLFDIVSDVPLEALSLAIQFWPGPLTMIFRAASYLPQILQGPAGTIGVRIPDNNWLRELIALADFPITATSANLAGEKEIADSAAALSTFSGKVNLFVDGGKTPGKRASSIVDMTTEKPKLLRAGAIPAEELKKFLD